MLRALRSLDKGEEREEREKGYLIYAVTDYKENHLFSIQSTIFPVQIKRQSEARRASAKSLTLSV